MLYDPKWKREDVHDLIAWLETRPLEENYNFLCDDCLIVRWMEGMPREYWPFKIIMMYAGSDPGRIASGDGTAASCTYGAALARARAAVMVQAA
jgi:hypothetical protein